ncbi:MAG: VOC family protein [Thermomicrobium sp.]|nr:VOC family protein [Thermomicrobium sp.]MDW8059056.1 VOC family protein [Thermomicrobium sp.]
MLLQIDHLVLLFPDLEEAIDLAEGAGFTVVRGGEHPTGTHNALVGFADRSYLELIAFRETNPAHRWHRFLGSGGGIVDLCLLVDDLAAELERLAGRGLAYQLSEGSRCRPDGVTIAWKNATPKDEATGLLPFLIEDVTPRDERVPHGQAAEHPNGVRGIAEVVVAVPELARAAALWQALTGSDGEEGTDRFLGLPVHRFTIGPHRVLLAADGHPVIRERLERLGPGPALARLWGWTEREFLLGPARLQTIAPDR